VVLFKVLLCCTFDALASFWFVRPSLCYPLHKLAMEPWLLDLVAMETMAAGSSQLSMFFFLFLQLMLQWVG
jgi:hypothetical protein